MQQHKPLAAVPSCHSIAKVRVTCLVDSTQVVVSTDPAAEGVGRYSYQTELVARCDGDLKRDIWSERPTITQGLYTRYGLPVLSLKETVKTDDGDVDYVVYPAYKPTRKKTVIEVFDFEQLNYKKMVVPEGNVVVTQNLENGDPAVGRVASITDEGMFFIDTVDGDKLFVPSAMCLFCDSEEDAIKLVNHFGDIKGYRRRRHAEIKAKTKIFPKDYVAIDVDKAREMSENLRHFDCPFTILGKTVRGQVLSYRIDSEGEYNGEYYCVINLKDGSSIPSNAVRKITKEEYDGFELIEKKKRVAAKVFKTIAERIDECSDTIDGLKAKLVAKHREREGMLGLSPDDFDKLLAPLEKSIEVAKGNAQIEDITIDWEKCLVNIRTAPLYIKTFMVHDTDITEALAALGLAPYPIGRYNLCYDIINGGITAKHVDSPPWFEDRNGCRATHPHISSYICWGTISDAMNRAAATMDIPTIAEGFIELVEIVIQGRAFGYVTDHIKLPANLLDIRDWFKWGGAERLLEKVSMDSYIKPCDYPEYNKFI